MTTGETELIHFIQNIIIFIQFKNKALFLDRDGVINNKEDNKKCKYRIKKLNLFFFAIIKKPKQFSFAPKLNNSIKFVDNADIIPIGRKIKPSNE